MRSGSRFGVASLLLGAAAILVAVFGSYADSVAGAGTAHVLHWLDAHGFVKPPQAGGTVEMMNPSALLLTDRIAIRWLLVHSWWFSACSMLCALLAELKREDTLYLSAGFVCSALAIAFFSPTGSIAAMTLGGAVMLWLRGHAGRWRSDLSVDRTVSDEVRAPPTVVDAARSTT